MDIPSLILPGLRAARGRYGLDFVGCEIDFATDEILIGWRRGSAKYVERVGSGWNKDELFRRIRVVMTHSVTLICDVDTVDA